MNKVHERLRSDNRTGAVVFCGCGWCVTVHFVPEGVTRQGSFAECVSRAVQHKEHNHTGRIGISLLGVCDGVAVQSACSNGSRYKIAGNEIWI